MSLEGWLHVTPFIIQGVDDLLMEQPVECHKVHLIKVEYYHQHKMDELVNGVGLSIVFLIALFHPQTTDRQQLGYGL